MKKKGFDYYYNMFKNLMERQEDIYLDNNKLNPLPFESIVTPGEIFLPCYNAEDETLSMLPPYWFISSADYVLSVYKGRLQRLHTFQSGGDDHPCIKFRYLGSDGENHIKTIKLHNLKALVFGADHFGKTSELLKQEGLFAFGNKANPNNVQGHHTKGGEIEFLTARMHIFLHKMSPQEGATIGEEIEYMQGLSRALKDEGIKEAVVLSPQDRIDTVRSVIFRGQAANFMIALNNFCAKRFEQEEEGQEMKTENVLLKAGGAY